MNIYHGLFAIAAFFADLSPKTHNVITGNTPSLATTSADLPTRTRLTPVKNVVIKDGFWSPKMKLWASTTIADVLNKFEGKQISDDGKAGRSNVFSNFDRIAAGEKGKGGHVGLPWFDGLVYETIRGAGDLLARYPNAALSARLDAIIDRIAAAQTADADNYINTYTDLNEPGHRWGDNGGFLRWQHDVYNAGMLVEAGVHYYRATGKTKLLTVATKFANHMSRLMGPSPKRNIVPAHSGPEEALIKLYWLYKEQPALKSKVGLRINEKEYFELARFWIEGRGKHSGYPLWLNWGNERSEKWIKQEGSRQFEKDPSQRPTWGDYAQDSIPVLEQQTIEGHAVRATLLATGVATAALENNAASYIAATEKLWNNMTGQRMFVTGGVGAIHNDEKFGPDYFLPTDAYLETCAAVGAGFFSQRMNELTGMAKYMDEFERVLYNNVLTGISLSGTQYTYQNPLNASKPLRWEWHSCPCCPPMFLKMVSALPDYIYATHDDDVYVNMFVGSTAIIRGSGKNELTIEQQTNYPWDGNTSIKLTKATGKFAVHLRIPGWALGNENPTGLYLSSSSAKPVIKVNGKPVELQLKDGYAVINRLWKSGDSIELELPVQPRFITASARVKDLVYKTAIASGPVIYSIESADNAGIDNMVIDTAVAPGMSHDDKLLNGVNIISGSVKDELGRQRSFKAVPYYAVGNRDKASYKVWVPVKVDTSFIRIDANKIENRISKLVYGSNIEDVNHEIYGGFYDQRIFGESFEEPSTGVDLGPWRKYAGLWLADGDAVSIVPGRGTHSEVQMNGPHQVGVEPDQSAKLIYAARTFGDAGLQAQVKFSDKGESAALLVRVSEAGPGNDNFNGYEISLSRDGKMMRIGKHRQNFQLLGEAAVDCKADEWNTITVNFAGPKLEVSLNGKHAVSFTDNEAPILSGHIGLRTWRSAVHFREVGVTENGKVLPIKLVRPAFQQVSYNWVPVTSAVDNTESNARTNTVGNSENNAGSSVRTNPGNNAGRNIRTNPGNNGGSNVRTIAESNAGSNADSNAGNKSFYYIDSTTSYNGKYSQVLEHKGGDIKTGIANSGLNHWGIAMRKDQVFEGRIYLKASKSSVAVTIALESADGSRTYASKQIKLSGVSWKKYPFTLTAIETDTAARFVLYLGSKGKLWVDQVVLHGTGADRYQSLPIRADIANAIKTQGISFLRYAGTMTNAPGYKFKNMIGDPDKRPPYRGHWNHYSTNGFGFEEFLQFCEAATITPCVAINIYETPEDVADMVEYLNGTVQTKWGAIRAKNGHPKPYGLKYIEIGNEEVIFNGDKKQDYQHYIERFKLLQSAMKNKDTSVKLIQSAWWRPSSPNMEMVFRELNGLADYWDLHVGGDDPSAGTDIDKRLTEMRRMMINWDPNTTMKIAVFEENGSKHGMQRALGHASNMNAIRRHNDYVLTSSPANALQPFLQNDNDWDQGQIFFTPRKVWGMPPFYSQKMQAENHLPIRISSESSEGLDVTAAMSEDRKTLALHVVNTGANKVPASLNLQSFGIWTNAVDVFTLAGELNGRNSPNEPEKYTVKKSAATITAAAPVYNFERYSYTILVFKAGF